MAFIDTLPGRAVSRIRAVYRASKGVGPAATVHLIRRRISAALGEDNRARYVIKVPGYPNPVTIRGGNGSDGFAFYQILAMKDFDIFDFRSPRFIIDCGANIGMSSLYFLNRYPTVKIVAIEPDPDTFEICKINLAPYADRVVLIQGAVWSACGRVCLEKGELEWNSHVRNADGQNEASVDAYDVPALIEKGGGGPVDLLKVDIEGGEAEVFRSGTRDWLSQIHNMAIEFHGDECERNYFAALKPFRHRSFPYRSITISQDIQPLEA
jgi:FkbM family methyltransferase